MEEKEELKTDGAMTAYNSQCDLVKFELRKSKSSYIGQTRITNLGEGYKILGHLDKKGKHNRFIYFLIEFEDRTKRVVNASSISRGSIKNPNTPSVCDIGFLGQGAYSLSTHTKEYNTWHGMLSRCYDEKCQERNSIYKGCTVDPRWHNFQNFCDDIPKIKGYKNWEENTIPRGYHLDKDIKIDGNKIYSKDTCMFVTVRENILKANEDLGYKLTGKLYLATFLETGYTEEFSNQSKFARDNNLHSSSIIKCLQALQPSHKGWMFNTILKQYKYIDEEDNPCT